MTEKEYEERIAEVKSIRYDSSLAIVNFQADKEFFQLIGDRRMTEPISEFIDQKVRLFITSQSVWSWQPLAGFNPDGFNPNGFNPNEFNPRDES